MSNISVEQDLTVLLENIQATNARVSAFTAEIQDVQMHASQRMQSLIEKIDAEKEQLTQKMDDSNARLSAALEATESLIEHARDRAAQVLSIATDNASVIETTKQTSRSNTQHMENAHQTYATSHADLIAGAAKSLEITVSRQDEVMNAIDANMLSPTGVAYNQTASLQNTQKNEVDQKIGTLKTQDFEAFCNEMKTQCSDLIEAFGDVRSSLESTKSENEQARKSALDNNETQLGGEISDTETSLTELGDKAREIGGTVGDGVDAVATLAQTSAVGLTTAIGALTSTYELLEEIKSAW